MHFYLLQSDYEMLNVHEVGWVYINETSGIVLGWRDYSKLCM